MFRSGFKGWRCFLACCFLCVLFALSEAGRFSSAAETEDSGQPEASATGESAASGGGFSPYGTGEQVASGSAGMEERISLDLRNIEVTEALRFLAMKGGFNLAVTKAVSGRLFLILNNVPIRDVFDIILLSNGLAYEKQGEIYSVMTEGEYKERYGRRFSDVREVKIFQLKYAVPERVFNAIDALKSDVGRVLVDQESGMVLVVDTQEHLLRVEQAIGTLEQKRSIQVFPLQYAKAEDIEERLKTQLDAKGVGTIVTDERSNQLVVQTLPERMETVAQLIKSLDQKTKEVLIVAKIIKVALSDDLNAEIQWEGLFKQMNPIPFLRDGDVNRNSFIGNHPTNNLARVGTSFVDDFVTITPTTTPTAGTKTTLTENIYLGQLGQDNVEVLLKFLRTIGETKVLSSPRLMVVNNQEAKIHVGERQAYVTTTTTTGQTGNTIAENVQFVDVGIQLSVTPTINDDGFVTMKIKPEISSVTSTLVTASNNRIPIVDTSEAETTVMVKDKTSIVIAGLRRDENDKTDKRIPFLGDLAVVGPLFRSVTKDRDRVELLILLTPHIVDGTQFVSGEPEPPAQAMKGYRDYPSLPVRPGQEASLVEPV